MLSVRLWMGSQLANKNNKRRTSMTMQPPAAPQPSVITIQRRISSTSTTMTLTSNLKETYMSRSIKNFRLGRTISSILKTGSTCQRMLKRLPQRLSLRPLPTKLMSASNGSHRLLRSSPSKQPPPRATQSPTSLSLKCNNPLPPSKHRSKTLTWQISMPEEKRNKKSRSR